MLRKIFRADAKKPEVAPAEKPPAATPSLALKEFIARLEQAPKAHVLDLGWACGSNLDFLGHRGCKIYIEDFYSSAAPLFPAGDKVETFDYDKFFEDLLPHQEQSMHGILSWDLFNYLPAEVLRPLSRRLYALCHNGGILFSLLSSAKEIPASPTLYRIVDEHHLHYQSQTSESREILPLSNNDLLKMVSPFAVLNSYFLRNGMREVLFIRRG